MDFSNDQGLSFLVIAVMMQADNTLQECQIKSIPGHALNGSVYQTVPAQDYPTCFFTCEKDSSCMSLNYLTLEKKCELNTQNKETKPDQLLAKEGSIYFGNFRVPSVVFIMKKIHFGG